MTPRPGGEAVPEHAQAEIARELAHHTNVGRGPGTKFVLHASSHGTARTSTKVCTLAHIQPHGEGKTVAEPDALGAFGTAILGWALHIRIEGTLRPEPALDLGEHSQTRRSS